MRLAVIILSVFTTSVFANDPVTQTSLPYGGTWEGLVGVSNGIPNRTTISTTLATSSTLAQINSAIAACPSNQVVLLDPGTFTLGAGDITLNANGVTLRGATNANGTPATTIKFASGGSMVIQKAAWDADNPGAFSNININSGLTRGSSSIVVASTPTGLSAGMLLVITGPRNAPVIDGSAANFANWFGSTDNHPYVDVVHVTGVSGTTVSFWPPLNSDYLTNGTRKVHFRSASDQISMSGLENLILTNATRFFDCNIVHISGGDQCWIKNCFLYGVGSSCNPGAGVSFYVTANCEVRHSMVKNAAANGSSEYGMVSWHTSGMLIEDNIFTTLPNAMPMLTTGGSAFANNIFTNEPYQSATFLSQIVFHHGAHNHYNLFEGNWVPTHYNDCTTNGNFSHSRNSVYFRQRMLGWDGNGPKDSNINCITLLTHHDVVSIVGNVMGHTGSQTTYEEITDSVNSGGDDIYRYDNTSKTTLTRKGNYNTIDAGIRSGEALTNAEALVTSYLHSSKPAWFGVLPWPWCDPTLYNQSNVATNFPAGYRLAFTSDPPSDVSSTVSGFYPGATGTTFYFPSTGTKVIVGP